MRDWPNHEPSCRSLRRSRFRGGVRAPRGGARIDDLLAPRIALARQRRGPGPMPRGDTWGGLRAGGDGGARRRGASRDRRVRTSANPRSGSQGGRTRRSRRRGPTVGFRRDHGLGGRGHRGCRGSGRFRHRRYRGSSPRSRGVRRRVGRSRRHRVPPGDHRLGRGQGVPRSAADVGVLRDRRCPGVGLATRLVPGVLHALVGPTRSAPRGDGRRGGVGASQSFARRVGPVTDRAHSAGIRTRRGPNRRGARGRVA